MSQDFANVPLVRGRAPQEGPARVGGTSVIGRILLVLALLAVVALAFAGGHYLGQQHGINQQKVAEQLRMQQQLTLQNKEINRLKKELAAKPEPARATLMTEVGELTFYDDLMNDKVVPGGDRSATKPSQKIEQNMADIIAQSQQRGAANLAIYIQLGSFVDEMLAKGIKQQVIALGMISYVQPVTLSGNRHRFRVQVGPYSDMKHAIDAKTILQHKLHMNGMITRAVIEE